MVLAAARHLRPSDGEEYAAAINLTTTVGKVAYRGKVAMLKGPNEALWRQYAPLPLRLIIGYGFMAHGMAKLSRGPAGFAQLLEQIHAPLPEATAWLSVLIETFGGLAILAGVFVAVVSIPL